MTIPEGNIPLLKQYINNHHSQELSDSFLEEQADLICRLLDSHYFATILFPNKHSEKVYYFSNNPEEFNDVYLPLQHMDVLQDIMIDTKNTVSYNKVRSFNLPDHDEFFHPLQKIRPVSDCLYIPFTLENQFCGFTAIARAGFDSPVYGLEDLRTFDFLSSYLTENFVRSFKKSAPEGNQAYLDKKGNILSCGNALKEILSEVSGDEKWDCPGQGETPFSREFGERFQGVLHNRPGTKGTMTFIRGLTYCLEFRKITFTDPSYIPDDLPVMEIILKQELREEKTLLDIQKIASSYEFTRRELQIVDCIYRGMNNSAISRELKISLSTVKKHIWNVFNKEGVDNRTGLIYALSL